MKQNNLSMDLIFIAQAQAEINQIYEYIIFLTNIIGNFLSGTFLFIQGAFNSE